MKRIICFILIFILLNLCGCQPNPEKNVITQKDDGTFEEKMAQTEPIEKEDPSDTIQNIQYLGTFTSTDGSVQFSLKLNEKIHDYNAMVEVAPHYISEEDAQRVAKVLFGDVPLYATRWMIPEEEYSKSEILAKTTRWSQYTNRDAVKQLFGREREDVVENTKKFIERYTLLYENAPDVRKKGLCSWQFKKDSYYWHPIEEITEKEIQNDNDSILAEATIRDIRYVYYATKRNLDDFKLNRITADIYGETSPNAIDNRIYYASLCRTEKPNNKQLETLSRKAEEMLSAMELGEWNVDRCYVETRPYDEIEENEYIIHVTAVPVINGIPAVRVPQLRNLKSSEIYTSNYYLSDVEFQFSANGDLIQFSLCSPIDVKKVISKHADMLPIDELIEKAKQHLSLSDSAAYGLDEETRRIYRNTEGEDLKAFIDISQISCGLLRIKAPNTDDSYCYVPGMVLYGAVEYRGIDTGTTYLWNGVPTENAQMIPLCAINSLDGSIIEISDG